MTNKGCCSTKRQLAISGHKEVKIKSIDTDFSLQATIKKTCLNYIPNVISLASLFCSCSKDSFTLASIGAPEFKNRLSFLFCHNSISNVFCACARYKNLRSRSADFEQNFIPNAPAFMILIRRGKKARLKTNLRETNRDQSKWMFVCLSLLKCEK